MLIRFRIPRSKPVFKNSFSPAKSPIARILQGLFVAAIGVVFMIANFSNASSFKEITGHVQSEYEHLLNNRYDSNWLQLANDPQDLYLFDKHSFHPTFDAHVFKRERVDVYYVDGVPRRVVALQLYNQFGDPTTKFTTIDFDNNQNTPQTNVGFDIGIGILIVGLLITGFAVFNFIKSIHIQRDTLLSL